MKLTDKNIADFQALWCKNFGEEITKEEALEKGLRLVRLVEIVGRAVANEQQDAQNSMPQL